MKKSYKILIGSVLLILMLLTQMMPVLAGVSSSIADATVASGDPAQLGQTSVNPSVCADAYPTPPPTVAQAVYDIVSPRSTTLVSIKDQPCSVKFRTNLPGSVTWNVYGLPEGLDYREGTDSNATVVNSVYTSVYMEVYGTPTKLGIYTFTVKATNGTSSATKNYNLTVYPKPFGSNGSNSALYGIFGYYVELRQMITFWSGSIKVTTLPFGELMKIMNSVRKGETISLKVGDGTASQAFEATGDLIKFMQVNSTSLSLDYSNVKCEIPSNALDIDKLAADLKVTSVNDIKIHIGVEEVSDPLKGKFKFSSKSFELKVTAGASNGNSIEITKLKSKIKIHLPVDQNISKPLIVGTRNVYRINHGRLHFCNSVFDGTDYVVDATESGTFAVLDFQANFSDVSSNYWAYTSIQTMVSRSVMFDVYSSVSLDVYSSVSFDVYRSVSVENSTGVDQVENISLNAGDFLPESGVSSRQLAGYLLQALNIGEENGDWNAQTQQEALDTAIKLGICDSSILSGADVSITREQMTVMVMNAYAYVSGSKLSSVERSYSGKFDDIDNLDSTSAVSIKAAYYVGVVAGVDANTFNPKSYARKDEAAALLARLLKVLNKL